MKYMVELHFSDDNKNEALQYFWQHGACHYEGNVSVADLWVASRDRIAYALVESTESVELEKACVPLKEFGTVITRPVASVDEL